MSDCETELDYNVLSRQWAGQAYVATAPVIVWLVSRNTWPEARPVTPTSSGQPYDVDPQES